MAGFVPVLILIPAAVVLVVVLVMLLQYNLIAASACPTLLVRCVTTNVKKVVCRGTLVPQVVTISYHGTCTSDPVQGTGSSICIGTGSKAWWMAPFRVRIPGYILGTSS